jgi:hypothetical protein
VSASEDLEKKDSLWDKLKGFFGKLGKGALKIPIIGALLGILWKFGKNLLSVGGWLLSFGKKIISAGKWLLEFGDSVLTFFKQFESVGDLLKYLKGPLTDLWEGFVELLEPFAAIIVFGSAIYGAIKGIVETAGEWKVFFKGLVDLGTGVFDLFKKLVVAGYEWVKFFVNSYPIIGKAIDFVVAPFRMFGELLMDIVHILIEGVKLIAQGFENITGWLGVGAGALGKVFSGFKKWEEKLSFTNPNAPQTATPPAVQDKTQQLRTATDMNQNATTDQMMNKQQLDLMEQQNNLLKGIKDGLDKNGAGSGTTKVEIGIKDKMLTSTVNKRDAEQAGLSGRSM